MSGRVPIDALLALGRAAYPGVSADAAMFEAFLKERSDGAGEEGCAEDLFLACAGLAGDSAALSAIEAKIDAETRVALRTIQAASDFTDEVRSRIAKRLLTSDGHAPPQLAKYTGKGALSSWIRVAALREGLSLLRRDKHAAPLDDELLAGVVDDAPDPETALLRARHGAELLAAFRDALGALPRRDRTLLRLHYGEGMSNAALGAMHGVNASTVSRWLTSARAEALRVTRKILQQKLGIEASALDSLLGLSLDLDMSINRLLGSIAGHGDGA
jgi:RNA polymerase sigma-70 factor (ECF subfamily)